MLRHVTVNWTFPVTAARMLYWNHQHSALHHRLHTLDVLTFILLGLHTVLFSCTAAVSRVCAVALYAVLEANAKVNGRGPFSHPHPSETPQPISMSCQIYYYVPPGSWCAKFGWNRFGRYGSAHAWKNTFCVDFFINISICLSVRFFVGATGHSFGAILTLNGSNDVISQPLVPFDGHINIAPH